MKVFSRLGLLALFACASLAVAQSPAAKPNFVLFISDDHGYLDSAPYGSTDIRTPNMTRLAAEGLKFTCAFAASPTCAPSRTTLLTGLWPARNGAEANHSAKRPGILSLPPALHALGYEVAAFGKVAHNQPEIHGFDVINPSEDAATVANYLASRDTSKPLCLIVGTHDPHVPWAPNKDYDPAALNLPPTQVDTPVTREQRANYSTDVTNADTWLGKVYDLTRAQLGDNTLTIYTSDQGAQWPFGKWDLYDAGLRVPLIAVWPGRVKPASVSDAMLCLPDILPTFIELAGGKVPDGLDGQSFAGVLRGETATHRDRVFATHSSDGDHNVYPIRCLRTRDWKYILNLHPEFQHHTHVSRAMGKDGRLYWESWLAEAETNASAAAIVKRFVERPAEELYDLKADPFELHNLAGDPAQAERLAAMRAELKAWMQEQGDQQTVFGHPLRIGEPVTLIAPPAGRAKPPKTAAKPKPKR